MEKLVRSSCIKQAHHSLVLCDDLKGWDWGEGGSRGREVYVHIQLIHVVVQEKLTHHCKAIML